MDSLHAFRGPLFSLNTLGPSKHCATNMSIAIVVSALLSLFMVSAWASANERQVVEGDTRSSLSLENAIHIAQTRDDWLLKSKIEQQRLITLSEGATALPDPILSVGLLNLPTDGFAFDQEPMTQLKVGASQMFPRGDTLSLQETQLQQIADIQPVKRADRRQKVALQTTLLWLDAFQSQASHALVKGAEHLFDKLGDVVSASYASSIGKANQQDLIRAELERVRLQDRLITLSTQKRVALSRLMQFLSEPYLRNNQARTNYENGIAARYTTVDAIPSEQQQFLSEEKRALLTSISIDVSSLYSLLIDHPLIAAIDQQISAERIGIDIAKQSHKPQFGVNASYALRDDTQAGNNRADFFSVGISVSLPLFSNARQDAQVTSSIQQVEAIKTDKRLVLRELMSGLKSSIDQYQGASQRLVMYQTRILPQMSQQSDVALNAYTNDLGDFAEVVTARIAELEAQITTINIDVARRKALASIEYYFSEYHIGAESADDANSSSGPNHETLGIK